MSNHADIERHFEDAEWEIKNLPADTSPRQELLRLKCLTYYTLCWYQPASCVARDLIKEFEDHKFDWALVKNDFWEDDD